MNASDGLRSYITVNPFKRYYHTSYRDGPFIHSTIAIYKHCE
jgi:hypothetical protein